MQNFACKLPFPCYDDDRKKERAVHMARKSDRFVGFFETGGAESRPFWMAFVNLTRSIRRRRSCKTASRSRGIIIMARTCGRRRSPPFCAGRTCCSRAARPRAKTCWAENLAQVFARPAWDVSFHVNMDAASLIGMDTFEGGEVRFRPGPVYLCAKHGGFGVLDEINMAKNEALAVLHATLDFRRAIDVPGYERVEVDSAARSSAR